MGKEEKKFAQRILQEAQAAIDIGAERNRRSRLRGDVKPPVGGSDEYGFAPPLNGNSLIDPDEQFIIQKESSMNPRAKNPKSSAFGLGQLLKGNRENYGKLLSIDPNTTDFGEQLQMFRSYIKDRYGTAAKARKFWEQHGWY